MLNVEENDQVKDAVIDDLNVAGMDLEDKMVRLWQKPTSFERECCYFVSTHFYQHFFFLRYRFFPYSWVASVLEIGVKNIGDNFDEVTRELFQGSVSDCIGAWNFCWCKLLELQIL